MSVNILGSKVGGSSEAALKLRLKAGNQLYDSVNGSHVNTAADSWNPYFVDAPCIYLYLSSNLLSNYKYTPICAHSFLPLKYQREKY